MDGYFQSANERAATDDARIDRERRSDARSGVAVCQSQDGAK